MRKLSLIHIFDDQVALMEKSYELAAKYMGQNGKDGAAVQNDNSPRPVSYTHLDEERGDLEPQQVCPRSERKRQVVPVSYTHLWRVHANRLRFA